MILSAEEVQERMKDPFPRKLVITPILNPEQINSLADQMFYPFELWERP